MSDDIDLFAGAGGWDLAARRLGVDPLGIELDPDACATREAAGLRTVRADLTAISPGRFAPVRGLIGSPPCPTFSVAGKGEGRKALDDILGLVPMVAHGWPIHDVDIRTWLVLQPLRWAVELSPQWIALEQVPPVLPVWQAYAGVLRSRGYHVAVGLVQAEQYGVPQTRKRAVLLAHRDRDVSLPAPTHSRYYSRDPKRLDPDVLPWVSMADAIGWPAGWEAHAMRGRGQTERHGQRPGRPVENPALTVRAEGGGNASGGWVLRSNYGTGGDPGRRGERASELPAPAVTSKIDRNLWRFQSNQSVDGGPRAERRGDQPSTTIVQTSRSARWFDGNGGEPVRVIQAEAAVLQSFPADFPWQGTKTSQFRQIGNAIPPLLALALLEVLVSP